jgi:hypothetical protein
MRFMGALLRPVAVRLIRRTAHHQQPPFRQMPVGDDSMHEKRKRSEGCRPGLRCLGGGQQTGRMNCSVGACVTATWAHAGHRRAKAGELAARQALGLGSERAKRRGSGVGINISRGPLDADRSMESGAVIGARFGLLPGKTFD